MHRDDGGADSLLDLDGQAFAIDKKGDYWVRFSVQRVPATVEQPNGLNYSVTLHGRDGKRILGFDNAHAVRASAGPGGIRRGAADHLHRDGTVRPYLFRDAVTLVADFWAEVDRLLKAKGVI